MVTRSRHYRAWSAMWPITGGQWEPQEGLEQDPRDGINTGTEELAGTLRDRLKRARLEPWRQRRRPRVEKTRPEQGKRP